MNSSNIVGTPDGASSSPVNEDGWATPAVVPIMTVQGPSPRFIARVRLAVALKSKLHRMLWMCLVLACLGASWFTYQSFLVPQPVTFAPDWAGARWVQAADEQTPVAYFRYVTTLNVMPDGAFVTVAASQVFRLYVNGTLVGSNAYDFAWGSYPRAYMYDIASLLRPGANVIALRVANVDKRVPLVRVSAGIVQGTSIIYHVTGNGWLATTQATNVYPHFSSDPAKRNAWTTTSFDASSWLPARSATSPSITPVLAVNPLIYERPLGFPWMSTGTGHDAYFVRQFSAPQFTNAWLRLAATGTASVFINGQLLISWNGQPAVPAQNIADYLSDDDTIVQYRAGLALGVYNITPYLHAGTNVIAVHVSAPGASAAQVGLDTLNAAISTDVLIDDTQGHSTWLTSESGWHASPHAIGGWVQGSQAALAWSSPMLVGRPGAVRTFYLSENATPRNEQYVPVALISWDIILSTAAVLGLWLLVGLRIMRRYYSSRSAALEVACLAYLPALALEALLLVLAREPLIPQPFPYTWQWGLVLLGMAGAGFIILWLNARHGHRAGGWMVQDTRAMLREKHPPQPYHGKGDRKSRPRSRWLRTHWLLIPIILLAIPLICYNLSYEPYWQDELTSYFAARGILAHGIPVMPSGFFYPKGELYSYLLALSMLIFGDQGGAPRLLSIVEYLVSLPLFYYIGGYFFEQRIALLATALLAFSPIALLWGREVRMYEQAQLLTLLVVYFFYRAVNCEDTLSPARRTRCIYLALISVVAAYLSHEETFIILPAVVLYGLAAWLSSSLVFRKGEGREEKQGGNLWSPVVGSHWLYATLSASSIIGVQLLLVHVTHPPVLGTDQSQRPLISFTTDNVPYYIDLLFFPSVLGRGTLPWITINSTLAVAGCVWAIRGTHVRAKYCACFLCISCLTLVFMFTLASDRYIYPILPLYYLLGAFALLKALDGTWAFARARLAWRGPVPASMPAAAGSVSLPVRMMAICAAGLVFAAVLAAPILPISGYNLFVSQQAGFSYHQHYPDYDAVGQYMQQHWRKGDIIITVAPAISILYYVGHVDYFFSLDRALYLFERDGHIIDTPTGSIALLNQQDFESVLAAHARVWIISDNGLYQSQVAKRFVFPPDLHIVYEGYGSAIYFRGG